MSARACALGVEGICGEGGEREVGTERRCGGGVGARPAAVGLALEQEGSERCMAAAQSVRLVRGVGWDGVCITSRRAGALMFQPLERSTLGCKCSTK